MPDQFKLNNPPDDLISAVRFQPGSSQLIAFSSWDCSVRIYDVNLNAQRSKYTHVAPVLDCCFSDAAHTFSGGLDQQLKSYDINTGQDDILGYHDRPIRKVHFCSELNLLVTGSWDSTVRLWDTRATSTGQPSGGVHKQPNSVYTLDTCGNIMVVGTAGRHVIMWDLRQMGRPVQQRESSLKFQTRCIRCFPNKQGYALSSIEGRVAVEFFDQDAEIQKKKYAFKCHRVKEGDKENIYPVNAMAFHQQYNTFATGGSDGMVNIWDGFNRKRLVQLQKFPEAVTSLAFSEDGSTLAIGVSYMNEFADEYAKAVDANVFIRYMTDQEVKPKHLPS